MIDKINKVRKAIDELNKEHIGVLEIDIIYELDSQIDSEISDDEYIKLYNEIEYAYLKVENVDIWAVVRCAIDNKDKIINEDEDFSLRDECCWY